MKSDFHSIENIVVKRENAGYQHFLFSVSGFEIPTYLLAKCKPKLENAS